MGDDKKKLLWRSNRNYFASYLFESVPEHSEKDHSSLSRTSNRLCLRQDAILIWNDRMSASKKVNWMAWPSALSILTTAFENQDSKNMKISMVFCRLYRLMFDNVRPDFLQSDWLIAGSYNTIRTTFSNFCRKLSIVKHPLF